MKRYSTLIAAVWIAVLSTACSDDQLQQYPETTLTEGSFYTNQTQVVQAVNDIYRQLNKVYKGGGIVDLYAELYSDNTYIEFTGGSTTFEEDVHNFRIQPNNGRILTAWNECYNAIYICNNALQHLEKTQVTFTDPTLKERLKGEALFVRSLTYFNMVRIWGGVPFPLKVVSPEESYEYIREGTEVIYQQLIADLKTAKTLLPPTYSGADKGRATRYAASAVLAKIYLTLGNKPEAAAELKTIIDSGIYSLDANGDGKIDANDFAHNFQPLTKNSKESVLELQFLAGQNAVNSNYQFLYTPYHWSFHLPDSKETFRGGGMNTPTADLVAEFEADDKVRKNITVYPGYVNLETGAFIDYPFTQKFFDPNWRYEGQNVELIRYADILLMYSEATGDPAYLNQVRARAGLPAFGAAGYPAQYQTLERAIEHERRVELGFEFHRFFDLVRTGRAVEVMKPKGFDITEKKLLFPIPQNAIDINPRLTQNPY